MNIRTTLQALNSERSNLHWLAFAAILLGAFVLRIVAFQGYVDSDPRAYAVLANDLVRGILHIPVYDNAPVFPLRIGTYGPTAAAIYAFGLSEATLVLYPFAVSIANCLLVYVFARLLVGPLAGLISLGLLAILPEELRMASMLYPDAISAFWAGVGVLLSILALGSDRPRKTVAHGLLAGLCFGISWLTKESVVFLAPFIAIYVLFLARETSVSTRTLSLMGIGLGSLAVLGAEILFYHVVADDALFRFHEMERNYEENKIWFFHQSSPYYGWESGGYVRALARRLLITGPGFILTGLSALPAFALVAMAWAITLRDRTFLLGGVWFGTLLLLFNFGSTSLKQYVPLTFASERYLYPLLLPAVILVSALIATLLVPLAQASTYRERAFWAWTIIATFCVLSVPRFPRTQPEAAIRTVASKLQPTDIAYTDSRTASILIFFRNRQLALSSDTTLPWESLSPLAMKTGDYVLVDREKIALVQNSYGYKPPEFVSSPPAAWATVWRGGSATLYRLGSQ